MATLTPPRRPFGLPLAILATAAAVSAAFIIAWQGRTDPALAEDRTDAARSGQTGTKDSEPGASEAELINYTLGYVIMHRLAERNIPIAPAAFKAGVDAAMSEAGPELTREQMREALRKVIGPVDSDTEGEEPAAEDEPAAEEEEAAEGRPYSRRPATRMPAPGQPGTGGGVNDPPADASPQAIRNAQRAGQQQAAAMGVRPGGALQLGRQIPTGRVNAAVPETRWNTLQADNPNLAN